MSNTLHPSTARRASLWLSVFSILPHVFCCMLPTVAALITLGTSVGLAAALATNPLYMLVDSYHIYFLGLAVAATCISGIINYVAYKMDCRSYQSGHAQVCSHPDCAPKKGTAFNIFYISCALLVLDVSYYLAEEHIFGLHNHGGHAAEQEAEHAAEHVAEHVVGEHVGEQGAAYSAAPNAAHPAH